MGLGLLTGFGLGTLTGLGGYGIRVRGAFGSMALSVKPVSPNLIYFQSTIRYRIALSPNNDPII